MANEIEKKQDFQTRMKDKIRDSIGDLMTDEELQVLIERGINETFFQEKIKRDSYQREISREPPMIAQVLEECLMPAVEEAVKDWLKENDEKVHQMLKELIEQGAGEALIKAIGNLFSGQMVNFQFNLENQINQILQNR